VVLSLVTGKVNWCFLAVACLHDAVSQYLTFGPHAVTRSCSRNQEYFGKRISST